MTQYMRFSAFKRSADGSWDAKTRAGVLAKARSLAKTYGPIRAWVGTKTSQSITVFKCTSSGCKQQRVVKMPSLRLARCALGVESPEDWDYRDTCARANNMFRLRRRRR